jgi:hypothetical protein
MTNYFDIAKIFRKNWDLWKNSHKPKRQFNHDQNMRRAAILHSPCTEPPITGMTPRHPADASIGGSDEFRAGWRGSVWAPGLAVTKSSRNGGTGDDLCF